MIHGVGVKSYSGIAHHSTRKVMQCCRDQIRSWTWRVTGEEESDGWRLKACVRVKWKWWAEVKEGWRWELMREREKVLLPNKTHFISVEEHLFGATLFSLSKLLKCHLLEILWNSPSITHQSQPTGEQIWRLEWFRDTVHILSEDVYSNTTRWDQQKCCGFIRLMLPSLQLSSVRVNLGLL